MSFIPVMPPVYTPPLRPALHMVGTPPPAVMPTYAPPQAPIYNTNYIAGNPAAIPIQSAPVFQNTVSPPIAPPPAPMNYNYPSQESLPDPIAQPTPQMSVPMDYGLPQQQQQAGIPPAMPLQNMPQMLQQFTGDNIQIALPAFLRGACIAFVPAVAWGAFHLYRNKARTLGTVMKVISAAALGIAATGGASVSWAFRKKAKQLQVSLQQNFMNFAMPQQQQQQQVGMSMPPMAYNQA